MVCLTNPRHSDFFLLFAALRLRVNDKKRFARPLQEIATFLRAWLLSFLLLNRFA